MLVRERMSRKVASVGPDTALAEARRALEENDCHHLPVVTDGRLEGIVSDRDLLAASKRLRRVRDVMSVSTVTVSPDASVDEAAHVMRRRKIHAVPVVQDDELVGILTTADVLDAFVDLCGVAQPSTRVTLHCTEGKPSVERIREVVQRCHGELKWLHAESGRRRNVVHLRLAGRHIDDCLTSLEGAGFEVGAVVTSTHR